MSDARQEDSDIPVEVSMSVKDWQWLDATIDNTVAMAAADGNDRAVEQGHRIRSTGWEAARIHPRSKDGWAGWPPVDDELSVSLPVSDWHFAIQELRRWDQIARQISSSAQEEADELRGPAIASFLEAHIQQRLEPRRRLAQESKASAISPKAR
ncbi:hypothetical protein [Arthrobacter sp. ISL-65]|uniref:hypothetical protein n=1 Tax=Arthrobacter sp. ISL-65 TaxID=2819112 RepID=UPI001BE74662|nr:hypothetical protein [Arthrobacter sp. ISL-65]MBT2549734.1 hypothetical protein [Arthrobacter sp. ISL-65]